MATNNNKKGFHIKNYETFGMCFGIALGLLVGDKLFNKGDIGMCIGMTLGMLVGNYISHNN